MDAKQPDAGGKHAEEGSGARAARPAGDDAQLWARASAGNEVARAELAELALNAARGELTRRGVRGPDLADLVQETQRTTFAFLARKGPAPRDLWTFLKYRAWGVLSDHRKKMRASRLDYRDDLEPLLREPAGAEAMPDRARDKEIAAALAECRRRLPPELARVLSMRYDSGLDTESIQSRLGIHRNTIHVRVFRALERLRECMAAKGYGSEDLQ
jgi:RNA polymerase sigma factor (sigma-70 family)